LGAMGDSFYEYLLKSFLLSGKTDVKAKELYFDAIEVGKTMLLKMLVRTVS